MINKKIEYWRTLTLVCSFLPFSSLWHLPLFILLFMHTVHSLWEDLILGVTLVPWHTSHYKWHSSYRPWDQRISLDLSFFTSFATLDHFFPSLPKPNHSWALTLLFKVLNPKSIHSPKSYVLSLPKVHVERILNLSYINNRS